MDEHKAEAPRMERMRSLMSAHIVFNNGSSTLDCVVRNISDSGARIETSRHAVLPSEFELHVPHKARSWRARIVWRQDNQVGVQFVDHAEAVEAAEGDAAHTIEELRAENARLRAKVAQLQSRLRDLEDRSSPI